jgi:hypothetical protein
MSMVHVHLLLNHVPVVGAVLIAALLVVATLRRSSEIAKTSLGIAVVIGVVSLVVYFTGEPAEQKVEHLAGISEAMIERHEDAALVATVVAGMFGALALGVLFLFRGRELPRVATGGSLAGALALALVMAWTANLGGQIRHSEIRGAVASASETGDKESEAQDHESNRKDR